MTERCAINEVKRCCGCERDLPLSAFPVKPGRNGKKRLGFRCRPCKRAYDVRNYHEKIKVKEGESERRKEYTKKLMRDGRWASFKAKRRAEGRGDGSVTLEVIQWLRDIPECGYCGELIKDGEREIDHITPLSRGGEHSADNLIAACKSCNRSKHAKTLIEFMFLATNRNNLRVPSEIMPSGVIRPPTTC